MAAKNDAKKAANIEAAARRLTALQFRQAQENAARKARLADIYRQEEERRIAGLREAYERQFVTLALNGKYATDLNRWLANRVPNFQRVYRFFMQVRPDFECPLAPFENWVAKAA